MLAEAAVGNPHSDEDARSPFAVNPTPDPGTRLSDEALWDEGSRPTGPAPDPAHLYTADEQAAGQHLIDVHDHLRNELARLRDLIEQVAAGTVGIAAARAFVNRMTIRQNNWTLGAYCASYCHTVNVHHTIEDRSLFPHLTRRDPRLTPVIDRLQVEHETIADVLEQVDGALVALVSEPEGVARLRQSINTLTDTLLSHLSYEERELVEPLARLGY